MFPYTEKYTESEYDIQNNNLLYKIDQQCQNTFEHFQKFEKFKILNSLFGIIYNLHNSYFVIFLILGFLNFRIFIFIIYTHTVVLSYCIMYIHLNTANSPQVGQWPKEQSLVKLIAHAYIYIIERPCGQCCRLEGVGWWMVGLGGCGEWHQSGWLGWVGVERGRKIPNTEIL